MATRQRASGSGSIYFVPGKQRWIGTVTLPVERGEARQRRSVVSPLFCDCLRRLTELSPKAATDKQGAPRDRWRKRQEQLAAARAIATHTPAEWHAIVVAAAGRCEYCGERTPGRQRVMEHRVPLSRGGSDGADNLAYSCGRCNRSKHNMTDVEFMEWRARNAS